MTEREIQKLLRKRFDHNEFHLCNAFIFKGNWESDYFCMTRTGYCYEIEIKTSYEDFIRDFKKDKHLIFENRNKEFIYQKFPDRGRGSLLGTKQVRKESLDGHFYTDYENVFAPASKIKWRKVNDLLFPNRYYFACPENILQMGQIPAYAGLIWIGEGSLFNRVDIIKQAPLLHNRTLNLSGILVRKFYDRLTALENRHQVW